MVARESRNNGFYVTDGFYVVAMVMTALRVT